VADVFANRSVRASPRLDGTDPVRRKRLVALKKLGIFSRENIVGHDAEPQAAPQRAAEGVDERRLAAADGAPDAHCKGPLCVIATPNRLPTDERPGLYRMVMRMSVRMPGLAVVVVVPIVLVSHDLPQL
jgi:hypothetical protein